MARAMGPAKAPKLLVLRSFSGTRNFLVFDFCLSSRCLAEGNRILQLKTAWNWYPGKTPDAMVYRVRDENASVQGAEGDAKRSPLYSMF